MWIILWTTEVGRNAWVCRETAEEVKEILIEILNYGYANEPVYEEDILIVPPREYAPKVDSYYYTYEDFIKLIYEEKKDL